MAEQLRDDDPRDVGGNRILARLGAGASGIVYLAEDAVGEQVAVKVLHRELAASAEVRRRLRNEAEALRRVDSDRVARVRSVETEGTTPHLVMDLVEGETLEQLVRRAPLTGPMVAAVAEGLVEALQAIHVAGIVHRDLKPSNVIFGQDGVRVVDFGVSAFDGTAGMTRTGALVGTPSWIAPEQATGEETGAPSDVFLLGMVIAYAASGAHPFGSGRTDAMLFRIVHEEPAIDDVPSALRGIVAACLAKDPGSRPTLDHIAASIRGVDVAQLARELPADRTYAASTTRLGAAAQEEADASAMPGAARRRSWARTRLLVALAVLAPLAVGLLAVLRFVDAEGGIVITYTNAAAANPQLREPQLIIRGAEGRREIIDLPEHRVAGRRIEARSRWRLSREVEIEYLPAYEGSQPFTTIVNPRRTGMWLLSRDRDIRISLDVRDTATSVVLTLPTTSGIMLARDEYLALELDRKNEREVVRLARQEAKRARAECTSQTRIDWRSRMQPALDLESNYAGFRERFGLNAGGTISEARYRNQMGNLVDAMASEYTVLSLIDPPSSEAVVDELIAVVGAYGSLLDAWVDYQIALLFPVRGSGLYADLYPVEHGAMVRAEESLRTASSSLGTTVDREVRALCERQHPYPG